MHTQFPNNYHSPFYVFIDLVKMYLLLCTVCLKVVFCCHLDCICQSCCALALYLDVFGFCLSVFNGSYLFVLSSLVVTSTLDCLHFHMPPLTALTWWGAQN